MPLPRVRFTVRRMMVAVAVVAGVAWAEGMGRRRAEYLRLTTKWAGEEGHFISVAEDQEDYAGRDRSQADRYEAWAKAESDPSRLDYDKDMARRHGEHAHDRWSLAASMRSRAAHASHLRHKYERAARFPFLPVASDPPEPE